MGYRLICSALSGAVLALSLSHASGASGVSGSTVVATFTDPFLSGYAINTPAPGDRTFVDNSTTATYSSLTGSTSTLTWGSYDGEVNSSYSSQINFTGGTVPSDLSSPFNIGTISFSNGSSSEDTLIFGATWNFYANSVAPSNFLGSDELYINTTANYGNLASDADWINICGAYSNICDSRIEAIENVEGGTGVTANLTGLVIGDPHLQITGVSLPPGESATTQGFIANGSPLSATPEPSTWLLMIAGLGGIGLMLRRTRKTIGFGGKLAVAA